MDIAVAGSAFWTQCAQGMLGVGGITCQRLLDLFVDCNIDLYTALSGALQYHIQTPFLIEKRRATEEQLGRQPPVGDVDGLFCIFEGDRDGPEVVSTIDIPLHFAVRAFREERLEAVLITDCCTFFVGGFLMGFIVAVIAVEEVANLADLVLEVGGSYLGIVELGVLIVSDGGCFNCV